MCLRNPLFCDLARALETLELLGAPGRHDFLVMAALETGGFFHQPEPANNWDSQQVEIKAHGIFASGTDEAEAIRNWMLVAARQSRVQRQVDRAENLLRSAVGRIDATVLRAACQTILSEGRNPALRAAAGETIANLDHLDLRSKARPAGDCTQSPRGASFAVTSPPRGALQ